MDLNNCSNGDNVTGNAAAAQQFPPAAAEAVSTAESSQAAGVARPENSVLVSMNNIPIFYARIGRRMLMGHGDDKPGFNEVIFTGLGMATKTAIGAASLLERDNSARIKRVETSYFPSTRPSTKMVPKITIVCSRTPEFVEQITREKAAAAENARAAAAAAAAAGGGGGAADGTAAAAGGAAGAAGGAAANINNTTNQTAGGAAGAAAAANMNATTGVVAAGGLVADAVAAA